MKISNRNKLINFALLLFYFSLLIVNHFLGYTGPFGFDDIEYARLGYLIFNGQPDWTNPFIFRFGIVVLNGIFQYFFGINEHIAAIYPLLISLGILIIVFSHISTGWLGKLIAGALLLASPWMLFYTDKISADIPIAFFILLSISILYKYRFYVDYKKGYLYGILLALTLFLGLLTKETIWFLAPFLAVLFCKDILRKAHYKFWLSTISIFLVFIFVYSLWQKIAFNGWFYRFTLITENSYQNICSYDKQPFLVVFNRVAYQLWTYLLKESSFIVPIVFLMAIMNRNFFRNMFSKENFWLLASVILVLSANFWTISYNSYYPLCIDVRHYLYIFPVLAIAVAQNYQKLTTNRSIVVIAITAVLVLLFSNHLELKKLAILNTSIILAVFLLMLAFGKYRNQILLLLVILPLFNLFNQIKVAQNYKYFQQKEVAVKFLKDKKNIVIYSSETQKRIFNYYLGFENKNKLDIAPYHFFTKLEPGYHYWNYHLLSLSNELGSIPAEIESVSTKENAIYTSDIIKIYKWNTPTISSEEFELNSSNLWENKKANKESHLMNVDDEYSPTFRKVLDHTIKNIYISSTWWLTNKSVKDATLVFSVEEKGKLLFYKGYSLKTDQAAVNNAYKLFKNVNIEALNIKDSAELKVYIWNNFKTQLKIDDAKINLVINR